ncbi:protein C2-DOMAIN ABA-RELATED 4-like isoform X1 [Silene latifolia]|uniref:protein C2-DOMAIN ABA-RELATED 4-like isoform X1 n=1 Tax=Silene latifolia TaxID=37657 RepID=UPI003D779295
MADMANLLRIKIIRGINLAVRDIKSSDPYVILRHGTHKLKIRYVKKTINPEWNEELTLSVMNPEEPVKLYVYDHDTFSMDDKMGDAEFDIKYFMEAIKMNLEGLPDGTVITKVKPDRNNCISEESSIVWREGKVIQNMFLRLRNVECGEIQLQLEQMVAARPKGG